MAISNRQLYLDRMLLLFACILHGATQAMHIKSVENRDELAHRTFSIIYASLPYLWARISPASFVKQREIILSAFKVFYFSFPLLRRRGGIQRVLDAQPRPGKLGFVIDTIKLIWGCRLMAVSLGSIALPSSLLLHLPVLLYSTLSVRGNKSLCETELLSHPITAARVAAFHSWADRIAQPVLSSLGFSELFAVALSPKDKCEAYLNWMYAIVGYVVPTIVIITLFPSIAMGSENSSDFQIIEWEKWKNSVTVMVWWLCLGKQVESRKQWDWCLLLFGWWLSFTVIWLLSKFLVPLL